MSLSINMLIWRFWRGDVRHYLDSKAESEILQHTTSSQCSVYWFTSTCLAAFYTLKDVLLRADFYFRKLHELFLYLSSLLSVIIKLF